MKKKRLEPAPDIPRGCEYFDHNFIQVSEPMVRVAAGSLGQFTAPQPSYLVRIFCTKCGIVKQL